MPPVDDISLSMPIVVDGSRRVSAQLSRPRAPVACLVLAHGAGAGMSHPFLRAVADGLRERRVATLRFQFPAMETGSRRPDRPPLAQATVRAAVAAAAARAGDLPLFAGGKSFGGRMTSGAQAAEPLLGVRGLIFFGFPLHVAKKPATVRAEHLADVGVPMLFLQGTRDALADLTLLRPVVAGLGERAVLHTVEGSDHSFHVPARSGRTDAEVIDEMLEVTAAWIKRVIA